MTFWSALLGLLLQLAYSRSLRGGVSGPISLWLGVAQFPIAGLLLWMLATEIGWWTIAAFVIVSFPVGLIIDRDNLAAWVNLQPITGIGAAVCAAGSLASYFLLR